jgi:hypothetical protein
VKLSRPACAPDQHTLSSAAKALLISDNADDHYNHRQSTNGFHPTVVVVHICVHMHVLHMSPLSCACNLP